MLNKVDIPILKKGYFKSSFLKDFISSIVVFLVAIPLCMGIAVASGTSAFNGLLSGIIGGIIVGLFSNSHISVSGPAAGLFVIVSAGIETLNHNYELFILAVLISGLLQIVFAVFKAGKFATWVPIEVIKGLMVAIGIILLLKQIPHALGFNADFEGDEEFFQKDGRNTFTEIAYSLKYINYKAVIITIVGIISIWIWTRVSKLNKVLQLIPAMLIGLLVAIIANKLIIFNDFHPLYPDVVLVDLPIFSSFQDVRNSLNHPNMAGIGNGLVWIIGLQIALVGSVESLLSLEAADDIDPYKRVSGPNRELLAQGIGNFAAGLVGALPLTSVVVRSSVNASAGAKTKMSAIYHGVLILIAVLFVPFILNTIPMSGLAAVLMVAGYRLAKPQVFIKFFKKGKRNLAVFLTTVITIIFTDVLIGVIAGLVVFVLLKYVFKIWKH
jgi:MFS superfamily sulfate permease-like transporter